MIYNINELYIIDSGFALDMHSGEVFTDKEEAQDICDEWNSGMENSMLTWEVKPLIEHIATSNQTLLDEVDRLKAIIANYEKWIGNVHAGNKGFN